MDKDETMDKDKILRSKVSEFINKDVTELERLLSKNNAHEIGCFMAKTMKEEKIDLGVLNIFFVVLLRRCSFLEDTLSRLLFDPKYDKIINKDVLDDIFEPK